MNHSYKLLGGTLVCLFLSLLLLQLNFGFFSPKNVLTFASHTSRPQPAKQNTTTVVTGGQGGVSQIPDHTVDPPACSSITSTPADVLKLLAPGWTQNSLSEQYRNETRQILCYDKWRTEWDVPGGTWLKISDFLSIMGWPSDLFDPSAGTQILIVSGPNDTLKTNNGTNNNNTQFTCIWIPNLGIVKPKIDLCDFGSVLFKAIVLTPLKWAVNATAGDTTGNTNSFFWTTPPKITYANPDLGAFWSVSLTIVNALLVVAVAWAGIRYMTSIGSWLSYADLLEMLPRIVLALIAAYVSARICQVAIDGSNALSSMFSHNLLLGIEQDPQELFPLFCQIIMCILILILILEQVVRYAILFVLIGFGPIWAFCGALRETQFIFKGALKALFFMSLLQPAQIAVLDLGQQLTKDLGGNAGSPLYYLVSIALMLFVLFMMSWFLRAGGIYMPYGLVGVAGLALSAQATRRGIIGTVRTVGRVGRRLTERGGSRGGAVGGGAVGGGGGSGGSNNGRSNNRGSNNRGNGPNSSGNSTRRRKVRRLPPYVLNSRRVQQIRRKANPKP